MFESVLNALLDILRFLFYFVTGTLTEFRREFVNYMQKILLKIDLILFIQKKYEIQEKKLLMGLNAETLITLLLLIFD